MTGQGGTVRSVVAVAVGIFCLVLLTSFAMQEAAPGPGQSRSADEDKTQFLNEIDLRRSSAMSPDGNPCPDPSTLSGFIGRWNVLGPIPGNVRCGVVKESFLGGKETDGSFVPVVGEEVGGLQWREVRTGNDGRGIRGQQCGVNNRCNCGYGVDLRCLFGDGAKWSYAYASAKIFSPSERGVKLRVSGSDGLMVFLNGRLIVDNSDACNRCWVAQDDDDAMTVVIGATLKEGRNYLLIKSGTTIYDWGFLVRLTDERDREMDDLSLSVAYS